MKPANVWPVDAAKPDPAVIARAAALIRGGELVAFPTETVYGLGANALETEAVAKIYAAKGRPATNPVIVHVEDIARARTLASDWPPNAMRLAAAFWPGPLTLVLPKAANIPSIVTAGGDTVALRVPNHPVALALLQASGVPIAAPSANRSTELSPTRAEHVAKAFREIPILDGGPCRGGIESTVVDVTGDVVRILRPGLIDAAMLGEIVGVVETGGRERIARSPGMMAKHYSPRTTVVLYNDEHDIYNTRKLYEADGKRVAVICLREWITDPDDICLGFDPVAYARRIYEVLHDIDDAFVDVILIEEPPDSPEWQAIRDRLTRAANK